MTDNQPMNYQTAGVDSGRKDQAMQRLGTLIRSSFNLRPGEVKLPLGYFANVIDVGHGVGVAVSTDGVGTKLLIAEMLHKYDTVGIDCVAMNVNDVLCVGAEPLALLDYIAVQVPHADLLESLAEGLYRGAEMARVTIPGGEIAQVKEIIRGVREDYAFDLVATAVGKVPLDRMITGTSIQPGDAVLGLASSGIHSNGMTLARRVFFERLGWKPDQYIEELGRTIGEELLEPTCIYVREVMEMIQSGLRIRGLAHITSTGFLNLSRAAAPVGYVLDNLPEPQAVYQLLQNNGAVADEDMYFTYNMGIGFCVILDPDDVEAASGIAAKHKVRCTAIGHAVADPEKRVSIPAANLVGCNGAFRKT
ncbi:MAG: phosphoribosylformylglycinamidine cyclo-ligase [Acidobacteriota bacterium]